MSSIPHPPAAADRVRAAAVGLTPSRAEVDEKVVELAELVSAAPADDVEGYLVGFVMTAVADMVGAGRTLALAAQALREGGALVIAAYEVAR